MSRFPHHVATGLLLVTPFAFGLVALALGQDANWDLRNYHWYNPHAFLNGRLAQDLGPAHVPSFYNPVLDLPLYLVGTVVPARVTGFALGVVHGLNVLPLFLLARTVLTGHVAEIGTQRLAAAIIAVVGIMGGGHLGLVGTTFNDNLVSLAVLGGAAIIVRRARTLFAAVPTWPTLRTCLPVAVAGTLVGAAVGLKLPTAPFAVGLCIAFLCVGGPLVRRLMLAFVFGLGVLAGFAVAGGPWMWVLWRDYGNPLFPYFNGVFQSPMGLPESYRDVRFVPKDLITALAFPFVFSADPKAVGEIVFRDYRIAAAYGVLVITAALAIGARLAGRTPVAWSAATGYVVAAAAFSYLPWLAIFGIYRYIVPLEMLATVLLVAAIAAWPVAVALRASLIGASLAALTVTAAPGDWEHVPWQPGAFVETTAPVVGRPGDTLAVITGFDPVAWVIPAFPPEIPFIRLQGYLNSPQQPPNGINARARARITAHRGDFFLLFPDYERAVTTETLAAYGLWADYASCVPVKSNLRDYVRWCRVYRSSDPTPTPTP